MHDVALPKRDGLPEDIALLNRVATELLAQLGTDLPEFLLDQIELAEGNADELSAQAWRDICDAAARLK
jgi:hypothetical protein